MKMKITIWGCRGSLPSPGVEKNIHGGNTSCVQVEHEDSCFILDGGSGIQSLGVELSPKINEINILLTHLHLDHIMELGYFIPFYNPNVTVNIYGPSSSNENLTQRLRRYFSPPLFPVRLNKLPAKINIIEVNNSKFRIDDFEIECEYICHPGPTVAYRCKMGNSSFAYMPDHEPALASPQFPNLPDWTSGYNIAKDVDLLFHDGQYSEQEYKTRIGWGHSSIGDAIEFGKMTNVKKMILFHHDPMKTDVKLVQDFEEGIKDLKYDFDLSLGKEKDVFILS